jgi:hypothetical protein
MMRFIPKDQTDLRIALERLPDDMRVEIAPNVGIFAVNVADLRQIELCPADIVVGIPAQRVADSVVMVTRLGESWT